MFTTRAAIFVLFSLLEEGEGLRQSGTSDSARTALDFGSTVGIFAYEFAFGFGAVGFVAFPVTFRFFTNSFTFRFGSLAVGDAMRLFADSDTFGAVKHFTSFIGAFNFTGGFFTFYVANCVFRLST